MVASNALSTVLKQLPLLAPEELEAVRKRCAALAALDSPSKPAPVAEAKANYIIEGLLYEARRRGLLPPDATPSIGMDSLAKAEAMCRHLEKYIRPLKSVEQVSLGRLAARCLAEYLIETRPRAPLGFRLLRLGIEEIPMAIENSYPGYMTSGLLLWPMGAKHGD